MEEMLATWRTAQYGRELFRPGPKVAIARGVGSSGAADTDSVAGPSKVSLTRPPILLLFNIVSQTRPSVNQVLLELDVTLSSKERLLAANPADQETASHIEVLVQASTFPLYTHLI
jgi:hypothetical protein